MVRSALCVMVLFSYMSDESPDAYSSGCDKAGWLHERAQAIRNHTHRCRGNHHIEGAHVLLRVCIPKSSLRLTHAEAEACRFVGSITRNRRYVKSYAAMSIFLFLCSLVSAALFLYTVYTEKNVTTTCASTDAHGNVSIDNCGTHLTTAGKVVVTIISVLEILVHLCEFDISPDYSPASVLTGVQMQISLSSSVGMWSSWRRTRTFGRAPTSSPRPTLTRITLKRPRHIHTLATAMRSISVHGSGPSLVSRVSDVTRLYWRL